MAACSCRTDKSSKVDVSCLGRCDLPKHRCLDREEIRPGPVPKGMGWLYTARDAPEHQLRCGWRPGHISCPVLRRIERHNCSKCGECSACPPLCAKPPCYKPCNKPGCFPSPRCLPLCPSAGSANIPCSQPLIRIVRHNGQYNIITEPSNISNHPSGPYPLKYVLNTDDTETTNATYSVEAKFNDYHFDYTSSTSSFVLDFCPPESKCYKPCPKRSSVCFTCQNAAQGVFSPPAGQPVCPRPGAPPSPPHQVSHQPLPHPPAPKTSPSFSPSS